MVNAMSMANPARPRGAQQAYLRGHNLGLVARTVAAADEPPSRADLATATGLTRATVSRLVDSLLEARILAELEPLNSHRAGRPAVPLVPASGTFAAIGLEANVDYIGGLVVDLAGNVISDRVVLGDLRNSDPREVLGQLGHLGSKLATVAHSRGAHVVGVGLAVPGLVDEDSTYLRVAPRLGWREVSPYPLLDVDGWLTDLGGLGLSAGNDAALAAVAETALMKSILPQDRTFLYVSGEIGVGAAIVIGGELFGGRHGWSGELGHCLVDPSGPQCQCGAVGCLEVFAGTSAILQAAGLEITGSALAGIPEFTELRVAAEAGEPRAVAAIERAGRALGSAIGDAINILDITTVVLGNRYADLADLLAPTLAEGFTSRALSAPWATPTITPSIAGDLPSLMGAAQQVTNAVLADPLAWLEEPATK